MKLTQALLLSLVFGISAAALAQVPASPSSSAQDAAWPPGSPVINTGNDPVARPDLSRPDYPPLQEEDPDDPAVGLENPHFEPPSSVTDGPAGTEQPDAPTRPMTPASPDPSATPDTLDEDDARRD